MAGFTLGGGGGNQQHPSSNESLFLYRNEDKEGFNLWQQHLQRQNIYSTRGNVGDESSSRNAAVTMMMRHQQGQLGMGDQVGVGGGRSCHDCGNQAKKDCAHMRCRTCCKSRGFECQTHVKSTWIPASKRREKQQQLATTTTPTSSSSLQQQHREISKRQRENPITRIQGLEVGSFPTEFNSTAVFRCVRVSDIDGPHDQLAYQTAVNIGGHVFKGILYDKGLEGNVGESSSGGAGARVRGGSPGNRIMGTGVTIAAITSTNTTTSEAVSVATPTLFDPSSFYPTPLNTFIAGTQFFPHPRS
ncbi:hypothetical protein GIB67_007995 [Kingdonia uniflora]|uniref:SHI n=1 Tax=Kingdonia uniflora TaxID=39325 RepID=A0A7J7MN86_9MAGN|nr:hypothetical protein GIB67_007995 [Kingdonia uniflora]